MVRDGSVMVDGACSQAVALVLPTLLVDMDVGNHTPMLPLRLYSPTYHLCPHTYTHHPHNFTLSAHNFTVN